MPFDYRGAESTVREIAARAAAAAADDDGVQLIVDNLCAAIEAGADVVTAKREAKP